MQTLTFNNKQLLFVPVPMEAKAYRIHQLYNNWLLITDGCQGYYKLPDNDVDYDILGTIQKENGNVSTTIPDEVLDEILSHSVNYIANTMKEDFNKHRISMLEGYLESQELTLYDGKKYVVLEIKK